MTQKRSTLLFFFIVCGLVAFNSQSTMAQTDIELYSKYIEKNDKLPTFTSRYQIRPDEKDYEYISIQESGYQTLLDVIKNKKQASVKSVFFVATDTTDIEKSFELLKQFTNIRVFNFTYHDDLERQYELPKEFLELRNLRFLTVSGAQNLKYNRLLAQIQSLPDLRGIDIANYEGDIPKDAILPAKLTVVRLSTSQLGKFDTKDATWHFAQIKYRFDGDTKDESLLQKLGRINSLEVLDCEQCYIKDETVFKEFKKLEKLTISPSISTGVNFVKALSVLTQLKELDINNLSDTNQSFLDLNKFKNLESLDLRALTRFQKHPEELASIGALTKLRALSIQSCSLSYCPDIFRTLNNLQRFTSKWNVIQQKEKGLYAFPESLYHLPELKELIIWRTPSELPSLENLSKLEVLELVANELKVMPEGLSDLKHLISLIITSNPALNNIDYKWEQLQSLETLDLSRNSIKSYPAGLQCLYQLKNLNLGQNKFSKIPPLQNQDYNLRILILDGNLLDNLPENISRYRDLEVLSANFCGLNVLPTDLGLLNNLHALNLERSHLTVLPKGIEDNLNLGTLNLRGNHNLDERSLHQLVFMKPKKKFLWANLEDTGLKSLPSDAPWTDLKLVLQLGFNQLKTLPVEMTKMQWFNITLNNNPFPIDTGLIERGIRNPADARIFFSELGYKKDFMKVANREMATSMSKAINILTFNRNFANAVKYASKAEKLDPVAYKKNLDRQSLGLSFYKTKKYRKAIQMLEDERKLNPKFLWNARMARASEEALAGSYRLIGDKRRSAETHAYFATRKEADMESSLNAAIGFLDINEEALSRKHFENAVAISKAHFLRYENQMGIFIYNYAEVLLMAEKPEQMLKLFADEAPKVSGYKPASRDYLMAVASLMINPDDYHSIRANYINSIAQHGKLTEWDYDTFNRWLAASKRSVKEKRHLQELEMLNK
jgi:Leucine-rich repeat (LRR) protein